MYCGGEKRHHQQTAELICEDALSWSQQRYRKSIYVKDDSTPCEGVKRGRVLGQHPDAEKRKWQTRRAEIMKRSQECVLDVLLPELPVDCTGMFTSSAAWAIVTACLACQPEFELLDIHTWHALFAEAPGSHSQ